MSSYAIYRLPQHDNCTLLMQSTGDPLILGSLSELNKKDGFVIAPFSQSDDCPILLLRPDIVESMKVRCDDEINSYSSDKSDIVDSDRENYHKDFFKFHSALLSGEFKKIVLSRRVSMKRNSIQQAEDFFMCACRMYPNMFVVLYSTPLSGTWLVATPEILLDGDGKKWHTMALAGTMNMDALVDDLPWSAKNIKEQHYVASYVSETLKRFTSDVSEKGPYTIRAADLLHLRSDFSFTLNDKNHIGDILDALHPTPAVCGLPQKQTMDFILKNEHSPRRYYSGFIGPVYPYHNTHVYVSLRCMEIKKDVCDLYVGGGLLNDSDEESEWQETENKLNTIKNVFK